jgi:hypothetical protein
MDSNDLARIERRARLHYEWGRAYRGLLGFAPMLLLAAGAAPLSRHPFAAVVFGIASFFAGATMLWIGRDARRAAVPGALAGVAPLVLTLCAAHVGHYCTGDSCMMLCLPACVAGGAVAGLAVATVATRRRMGAGFWAAASAMAMVTAATGCSCAGASGLLGLLGGYAAGVAPFLVTRAFGWRSP